MNPQDGREQFAGDTMPPECVQIEVHVDELKQLFNAMDPSPFRERDLDPQAEDFIVSWASEAPRNARLGLLIRLDRGAGQPDEAVTLRDAVHEFFAYRAVVTRRKLRDLFRRGRASLLIGLLALAALFLLSDLVGKALEGSHFGDLIRESLLIGGWVAMWRPLEIFLYDWWPIRAEAKLYDRLAKMPVRIAYQGESNPNAWRNDWPAVGPAGQSPREQSLRSL